MLMLMPGQEIEIKDVVSVAMVGMDIPVEKLSSGTEKTECEPEHGGGVVCKPGGHGVAVLIYSSGKLVCTGAKTPEQAREAIAKAVGVVKSAGVDLPADYEVKTENIVAKSRIGDLPGLDGLAGSIPGAEYHPGNPPGMVYRVPGSGVSMIVSPGGKVILTGAREVSEIKPALDRLKSEIEKAQNR